MEAFNRAVMHHPATLGYLTLPPDCRQCGRLIAPLATTPVDEARKKINGMLKPPPPEDLGVAIWPRSTNATTIARLSDVEPIPAGDRRWPSS